MIDVKSMIGVLKIIHVSINELKKLLVPTFFVGGNPASLIKLFKMPIVNSVRLYLIVMSVDFYGLITKSII